MHVYVWEHILSLSSKTAWLILTKLVSDELLMVSYKFYGLKTTSAKGRIQGGLRQEDSLVGLIDCTHNEQDRTCGADEEGDDRH